MSINMESPKENKEKGRSIQKNISQIPDQLISTFSIDWKKYKTKRISNSVEEGKILWLNIKNPVTIYYLEWSGWLI